MDLSQSKLFSSFKGNGALDLKHRIVLAPLTRNRGTEPNLCPYSEHVKYYSQRASPGGLLITEAVPISPEAVGYVSVPGIWTDEQVEAWKSVTKAVHDKGAVIFMQLWHVGRVAHPSFGQHPLVRQGDNAPGVSASAVTMVHPKTGKPLMASTYNGSEEYVPPRALKTEELARVCQDYAHAAKNAIRAGFDGVEVHAAHGYLIDQFIQNGVNKRTDQYGGSVENRCRLLKEVCTAVSDAVGAYKMSVRLSPTTIDPRTGRQNQNYFTASTSDPDEVYAYAVNAMNDFKLAYLLLTEPRWNSRDDGNALTDRGMSAPLTNVKYRNIYHGTIIAAGGFTPTTAAEALEKGYYDLIAFGRWFIANPDLPERIKEGSDLNHYDRSTFYSDTYNGGAGDGYTDYPDRHGTFGAVGKYKLVPQSALGTFKAKI